MCSLQEHIEREIRARQAEQEEHHHHLVVGADASHFAILYCTLCGESFTVDVEQSTENVSPAP